MKLHVYLQWIILLGVMVICSLLEGVGKAEAASFVTPNPLKRHRRQGSGGGAEDFAENMKPWMELGQKYGPISKFFLLKISNSSHS